MIEYCLITPLDVLYLRGNRLFGDAGGHSEALMPPWPSVAAGALRSRMLSDANIDFSDFAQNKKKPDGPLGEILGIPEKPGSFRLTCFTLGRRSGGTVGTLFPLPADLAVQGNMVQEVEPVRMNEAVQSSYPLTAFPVLKAAGREKAESGIWLNEKGLNAYIRGEEMDASHWVRYKSLWRSDTRLGIGMDWARRVGEQGRIYTSETVKMEEGVGFLVGVDGTKGLLPKAGFLRFGGDGRGAVIEKCAGNLPEAPWEEIEKTGRFRLILATPGLFSGGWVPQGIEAPGQSFMWNMNGCRAKLVAASLGRPEMVSGWDVARDRPKKALKAAPVGSVYWFEGFAGDVTRLRHLLRNGLWNESQMDESLAQRRAEGFNNVFVSPWRHKLP